MITEFLATGARKKEHQPLESMMKEVQALKEDQKSEHVKGLEGFSNQGSKRKDSWELNMFRIDFPPQKYEKLRSLCRKDKSRQLQEDLHI